MLQRIASIAIATGLSLSGQIPDFKPPNLLFGAILRGDAPAVQKLLDEGANPNEARFFGFSALHLAVIGGNRPIIQTMLSAGADKMAGDQHGSTPLMWAVGSESPDYGLIDQLLSLGVNPNTRNKTGETALTWAMRRGDISSVQRLKAAGASDAGEIKQSVEKAIALLQKSGPQFVKVSGCVSCHHQSLPQMAFSMARDRGYQVDSTVSEQQIKAVVAMFKPIREQMENGTIHLPDPAVSVSYVLLGLAAEGYAPDAMTSAMAMTIERTQMPDGSFAVMPARPPLESSAFTSTALSARALKMFGADFEGKVAKAREWLVQARPMTQEDRSMRLLGLVWLNAEAEEIERAASELIAQQRPDGGWAQLAGLETDAYATGQAMVALHESKMVKVTESVYQRGLMYLLRTQFPDGSWLVRTRSSPLQPLKDSGFPHGRDQWISASGTSWAAMALTLSQPKVTAAVTTDGF